MRSESSQDPFSSFHVWGLTYEQADAEIRSQYSLTPAQQGTFLSTVKTHEVSAAFALSTCNRTEIYGYGDQPDLLLDAWMKSVDGNKEAWKQVGWYKKGEEAVYHLFRVCCGLDSQILGDIQILGQVKTAYSTAKKEGLGHGYFERLLNTCIEAHKSIKNQTAIGSGASSVSYLAAQAAKKWSKDHPVRSIFLLGAGSIGKATCANLRKLFPHTPLHISNRTFKRAQDIAAQFDGIPHPWEDHQKWEKEADLVVVATSADAFVINPSNLKGNEGQRMIIDLGIPLNVNPEVAALEKINLLNTDTLSTKIRENQEKRAADLPIAQEIVDTHLGQFAEWLEKRRLAPVLAHVKAQAEAAQTSWTSELAPGPAMERDHLTKAGEHLAKRFTRMVAKSLFANPAIPAQQLAQIEQALTPQA